MVDTRLLESIIGEVRSLFHLLRASAVDLHGLGPSSAGLRGILESIADNGPQTTISSDAGSSTWPTIPPTSDPGSST